LEGDHGHGVRAFYVIAGSGCATRYPNYSGRNSRKLRVV
jgi:hypothetical protein